MKSRSDREQKEDRGAALFALLFSLVLIGGLVHGLTSYSTHYGKLAATYTNGARVRELLRGSNYIERSARRGCVESYVDGGDSTMRVITTCAVGEPPFRVEPATHGLSRIFSGRPDYGALFAVATPCPTTLQAEIRRSFTSPVSPERCVVSVLRSSTIMSHNIEVASIELQPQANVATIGTPGELTVTNVLSTEGDVLIVTGGSIRIPSLVSPLGRIVRVTLLSAHGDIEVRSVSSNVSVLSIGRRLIAVPLSATSTGHPLPPLTVAGISGMVL